MDPGPQGASDPGSDQRHTWSTRQSSSSRSTLRPASSLFVVFCCVYLLFSTGRVHVPDEASAFFQARNLVEIGSLVVPEATPGFEFYGRRDLRGRPRAPYGPVHALAIMPFYLLGKALAGAPGVPGDAADLVMTFGAVLSSAVFAAVTVALFCRLLIARGFSRGTTIGASVCLAISTPLFAYSAYLYSEPLAALLLAGAALALFGRDAPLSVARGAAGGALIGAAMLVRPAHALALPIVVTALLMERRRVSTGGILALVGLFATAAVICLAWNQHLYGDLLQFGYPDVADGKAVNNFSAPILRGLTGLLVSPGKSLFVFAPVAIVALAGLPQLFKRDQGLALFSVALPIGYLLLYSRFSEWEGGYSVGPRYLVPTIPILLVGLAPVVESGKHRRVLMWFTAFGIAVQLISISTSFLEDQRRGSYYNESFTYRMSYFPLLSQGQLLIAYAADTIAGRPEAPLGKGFDRWWIFLRKARVASATLATWALAAVGASAVALFVLTRADEARRVDST